MKFLWLCMGYLLYTNLTLLNYEGSEQGTVHSLKPQNETENPDMGSVVACVLLLL